MITQSFIAAAFGVMVGLSLGLTGGGGSIFAMPLLVYGLHLSPIEAVPISLVAVGFTALAGALHSIRARLVVWQPTIMFVIGGVIGAPAGIHVATFIPSESIIVGFAALATTIGAAMWIRAITQPQQSCAVRAKPETAEGAAICTLAPDGQLRFSAPCALVLSAAGLATGALSGLFGVGGGFLIVPALMLVTRMGVHSAVATSLLIISAIGFSGAAGAVIAGRVSWPILIPFAIGGAAAMFAGRRFADRVSGPSLQRFFSVLILLVGVSMLIKSVV
ncbi:MAG: sulfite exporter TauE/SafE family protein [Gammaproteobacteria bacterium]|jgi:uncharacterized membrane protein YfcA